MSEINYFKKIIIYNDDVVANVDHLIKKIYLADFSYIV
jgi:hypothetical protein